MITNLTDALIYLKRKPNEKQNVILLCVYFYNSCLNNFELFITSQPAKQIITLAELKLKQIIPLFALRGVVTLPANLRLSGTE